MNSKYIIVKGKDYNDVRRQILIQYGDKAQIVTTKEIPVGGIFGMFARQELECMVYLGSGSSGNNTVSVPKKDEENKKEILNSIGKTESISTIMADIKDIKAHMVAPREAVPHESLTRVEEILQDNDFSLTYIRDMVDRLKREFSLDDLDDFNLVQQTLAEWIYQSIPLYQDLPAAAPEVQVLVGPTGVGKTTTIAKLAALKSMSGQEGLEKKVCIITIDSYRIGARAQIETYGEIMEIPVYLADTYDELRKYITLHQSYDLILVDTIGKSPKDFKRLGEMRETLEACGANAKFHLALSSTTKTGDLREIIRQFDFFNYQSIVLTKLDETSRVGNLISILSEKQIALSYVTTGQSVPSDIEAKGLAKIFINKIQGLQFRLDKIERKLVETQQKRWS